VFLEKSVFYRSGRVKKSCKVVKEELSALKNANGRINGHAD